MLVTSIKANSRYRMHDRSLGSESHEPITITITMAMARHPAIN
jgi:hypothetical protein